MSETIADILTEMRTYVESWWSETPWGDAIDKYADRIEATHNRELESVTDCNGLNAVKAYEVVAKWRNHLEFKFANGFGIDTAADIGRDMLACLDEIKQFISVPSEPIGNNAKIREALEQIHKLLSIGGKPDTAMCIRYEAAFQIAKEALSAPPRNCERFNNADELVAYSEKELQENARECIK